MQHSLTLNLCCVSALFSCLIYILKSVGNVCLNCTVCFRCRFPYTAVSIGLLVNQKAQIGIVYNPILDEMYSARLGQGAFCNDKRLQVTSTKGGDRGYQKLTPLICVKVQPLVLCTSL